MDRQSRLQEVIAELERRFGPGVVYRLSQARPKLGARSVSTGSLGLDWATGVGGVPRGRITAVDGPESSGKTTLAYHVLADAQRDHGLAAFVDAEHSADPQALRECGVDFADLILGLPMDAAEALEMAGILARSAALDAVVLSALPRPYRSALLAEGARRLVAALAGTPTALVLVGLAGRATPVAPTFASLALRLWPLRLIRRSGGEVVGFRVRAEVARNKLAPPGATVEFDVVEGRGIHRPAELYDLGLRLGLIEPLPIGPTYAGCLLGASRGRAILALERDRALAERLEGEIRRSLLLDQSPTDAVPAAAPPLPSAPPAAHPAR